MTIYQYSHNQNCVCCTDLLLLTPYKKQIMYRPTCWKTIVSVLIIVTLSSLVWLPKAATESLEEDDAVKLLENVSGEKDGNYSGGNGTSATEATTSWTTASPSYHCQKPTECVEGRCNYVINIPAARGGDDTQCHHLQDIVNMTNNDVKNLVQMVHNLTNKVDQLERLVEKVYNDTEPCLKYCKGTTATTTVVPSSTTLAPPPTPTSTSSTRSTTTVASSCLSYPCYNNGTCTVSNGQASCQCTSDWVGPHCARRNNCTINNNPCVYGNCTDSPNGPVCHCKAMWTGLHCDHPLCCNNAPDCVNPCGQGNCTRSPDQEHYTCTCLPGWTGPNCNQDVNECLQNPSVCGCGSTCTNTIGSYVCHCAPGYTGPGCCEDINECLTNPCKENGTCHNSRGSYHCTCPGDTTGAHCQHHLTCKMHSCGRNAICFVNHHGVQCVCQPGYSGNPYSIRGCSQHLSHFCGSGDPHYRTFDGQFYDYQGTCPYVWTKVCNSTVANHNQLPAFEVQAKNLQRWSNSRVSYVEYAVVAVYGVTIKIARRQVVTVNGVRIHLPWYYPSKQNSKIALSHYGWGGTHVSTDFGFSLVYWSNYRLCVYVPYVQGYSGNLCGLGGNMNKNYRDDMKLKNGTIVSRKQAALFGDSWVTIMENKCLLGQDIHQRLCTPSQHLQARIHCSVITNSSGPFAACVNLNTTQLLYEDCVYDMCAYENAQNVLCNALSNYATHCQALLPGTPLIWRSASLCPMPCGANQHYEPCSSSCPSSCSNHTSAQTCNLPCYEGCACNYGYILSGSRCVKIENCGCSTSTGNYYPANATWVTENCTSAYQCKNGTIQQSFISCTTNAECTVKNMKRDCYCKAGFGGNGRSNCTDIDECRINGSCVHGTCRNTIGNYTCSCKPNWTGRNCGTHVDYCKNATCEHGGRCNDTGYGYVCLCTGGWYGPHCNFAPQRHCADLQHYHHNGLSGRYPIRLPKGEVLYVYCDMITAGGGWTVISRRIDGSVDFYKNWTEYENGFGSSDLLGEFWMGNRYLAILTNELQTMKLRVDLWYCNNIYVFETYGSFRVANASSKYALSLGQATGPAQNGLAYPQSLLNQNGAKFSTKDQDNDNYLRSCSMDYHGGFWYNSCCGANLNGRYYPCGSWSGEIDGIFWFPHNNDNMPANHVEMKFRPTDYNP